MSGLSISGFKKNAPTPEVDPSGLDPVENQQVETQPEVTEPTVNTSDSEPVAPVEANAPTTEVAPSQDTEIPVSTGVQENNSLNAPSVITEPVQEVAPQINDDLVKSYLSEKLGTNVDNLDQLLSQPENPLDKDPYLKELYEWRAKTGRPIEDFARYQKDYSTMSDLDIAKEFLQHEYPTLTNAEVNLELKKFVESDDDLDSDISLKKLELKKLATKGRAVLDTMRLEFSTPANTSAQLTPDVQQELDFARSVKSQNEKYQALQQEYNQGVTSASSAMENVTMKLSDDLSINFRVPQESKKDLPNFISDMPHWKNSDGSWNHQTIVSDGAKIKHFDDMMKLAYEQGLNAGKEDLSKQTNNITLDKQTQMNSQQGSNKKRGKIEGFDSYLGQSKIGIKRRY